VLIDGTFELAPAAMTQAATKDVPALRRYRWALARRHAAFNAHLRQDNDR
jgi:hypothetical protein